MSGPWGLPKIDQFKFVHFRLFSGFKMFLDVLSHFKPTHHMKLQALAAIADPQETANSGRSWCPPTPQPPWPSSMYEFQATAEGAMETMLCLSVY